MRKQERNKQRRRQRQIEAIQRKTAFLISMKIHRDMGNFYVGESYIAERELELDQCRTKLQAVAG